jgi:TIR domain
MKVFLSWSGEKSRDVALALREWLPGVINSVEPFVSSADIDPGTRWQQEVAGHLEATSYGIICVTRENQFAPWLNFEAGALAKAVESSRVIPLAIDLKPSDIVVPLGQFQAQPASEAGICEVVKSINAVCTPPLDGELLKRAFEKWWPDLQGSLEFIEAFTPVVSGETRTDRELLEETLDTVRSLARQGASSSDQEWSMPPDAASDYAAQFKVGSPVLHGTFGNGEVVDHEPAGIVIIRFDSDGSERKFYAPRTPLTRRDLELS